MKKTLLELTQNVLTSINGDDVNSISDTVEAQDVAQIIRDTYEEMISNRNWPHLKDLDQLEGVSDTTRKTHLKLPDSVREVISVKYNVRTSTDTKDKFKEITYKYPEDFLDLVNNRDES